MFKIPYNLSPLPEKFDAIIPIAQKDFTKLPFVVEQLFKYVPIDTAYIVSPTPVYEAEAEQTAKHNTVFLKDSDVLPVDPSIFQPRTNWIYQQWIKLQIAQNITKARWFITVDADLFVLKPLPFVVDGKPGIFYARDRDRIINGYGRFTHQMLGYEWNQFSLMNDITLYNIDVIRTMVDLVGGPDAFIAKAAKICKTNVFPAEAQLYYAWIQQMYPGLYEVRTVTNGWRGMYRNYEFTTEEVSKTLKLYAKKKYDTFSLHSWSTNYGNPGARYKV